MTDHVSKQDPRSGAQIIKKETNMSNQQDVVVTTERRKFIIQAFVALPFLIAGVFLMDIAHMAMGAELSEIATSALWMTAFIVVGGALMLMLLRTFDRGVARQIVFGVALLLLVVWLGHALDHVGTGLEEGINTQFPFNFAFDVFGFSALVVAWKWARLKKQAYLQAITT